MSDTYVSFPFDFTVSLPNPMPQWTDADGHVFPAEWLMPFTSIAFNDVLGLVGQLQFGPAMQSGIPLPAYEDVLMHGIPVRIYYQLDGGNLRCTCDIADHDWYFPYNFSFVNDTVMLIEGNNSELFWSDETFVGSITNNITGMTIPLHFRYPVGGGTGGGPGYWSSNAAHTTYRGAFQAGEILTQTITPPPPLPDKGLPMVSLSSINLYPLPCFTPCTPHAIKQL